MGGDATLLELPSQDFYPGSVRNGITSRECVPRVAHTDTVCLTPLLPCPAELTPVVDVVVVVVVVCFTAAGFPGRTAAPTRLRTGVSVPGVDRRLKDKQQAHDDVESV